MGHSQIQIVYIPSNHLLSATFENERQFEALWETCQDYGFLIHPDIWTNNPGSLVADLLIEELKPALEACPPECEFRAIPAPAELKSVIVIESH